MKNDKKPIKLKRRLYLAKNQKVPDKNAAMIKLCKLYSMPLKEFFRGHNDKYQKFVEYTDGRFDVNKTYGEVCRVLSKDFFDGYSKFFFKENTQCFETCSYITKPLNAIENLADAMVETEKSGDCTMLPQDALFFNVRMSLGNYIDAVNSVLTDENNYLDAEDFKVIGKGTEPLTQVIKNLRSDCNKEFKLILSQSFALDNDEYESVLCSIAEHGEELKGIDNMYSNVFCDAEMKPLDAINALKKRYYSLIYKLYMLLIQPFGYDEWLDFSLYSDSISERFGFKNDTD